MVPQKNREPVTGKCWTVLLLLATKQRTPPLLFYKLVCLPCLIKLNSQGIGRHTSRNQNFFIGPEKSRI